ncbi:hypothetical protein [Roseovarius spongiae]|uniref:hypothetical protein n=1 Tax=Roseovarius spongiae TaxID=2320272 RepID=UPI00140B2B03|nr:hypothetical protein [Roseovarius spongiae]
MTDDAFVTTDQPEDHLGGIATGAGVIGVRAMTPCDRFAAAAGPGYGAAFAEKAGS